MKLNENRGKLENVKKCADGDNLEENPTSRKRGLMYKDGYKEIADYWFKEYMKVKKIEEPIRKYCKFMDIYTEKT